MKKSLIIFFLIIFDIYLVTLSSHFVFAIPAVSTIGPTPPKSAGQNPAPPLSGSTACGKTVCLANEICVQYPHDKDQHCVPANMDPAAINADPIDNKLEDCWDQIGQNKGSFPPNTTCWNHVASFQKDMTKFDKTCIYQPVVQYTDTRTLHGGPQPFEICGNGDPGPFAKISAPGGGDDRCWVAMLVYTDVRDATLGSYGPDIENIETKSSDYLAQNYLYNSLFGRPNDLSNTNREEYRTYWRLLPAANQANLRSYTMNMAKQGLIEDINFDFTDTTKGSRKTSFTELYDKLSKQIILFLHPPFIRIGCLTDYPVCPEFAKAIKDLKTPVGELVEFAANFPFPIDTTPAINFYSAMANIFGFDIDGAYSAFTPLDFGSVRGYIVKKKDDMEDYLYTKAGYDAKLVDNLNKPRYGTNKPSLGNVSFETLPYIGAIYQGLLSPKFGIMGALQPQWLIDKYATPEGSTLYDYKAGNSPQDYPEVKISAKNFLSRVTDEIAAMLKNPINWTIDLIFGEKDKSFSKDNLLPKGYNEPYKDNEIGEVRSQYVNMKNCPLPVSYHLAAPFTANKSKDPFEGVSKDDHHQVIYVNGKHIQWSYNPDHRPLWNYSCKNIKDANGNIYKQECGLYYDPCPQSDENYELNDQCYTRKWDLTAIEDGKALTVLNNPKQTDIKKAVVEDNNFSLYKTLLPDASGSKKVTDANVDAPLARHFTSYQDGGNTTSTAPTGETLVFNPAEPVNRVNNRAQDSVHLLQNCWAVPDKLQNSPRCKLALTDSNSSGLCTGEAFAKLFPDPAKPSNKANNVWPEIESKLTDDVVAAYVEAEKQTGVPCEVLAGIHFEEGNNNADQDLQSGAPLAGRSLTESAVQAATELLGKAGGVIDSEETLIKAMSWYNGGGNSNCQSGGSYNCPATSGGRCGSTVACGQLPASAGYQEIVAACTCGTEPGSCRASCRNGFPFQFDYKFCAPKSIGYDDPYVTNWWISPEHDNMYLLYTYDCTATTPHIHERPGSLTVAIMYYLSHK